MQRWCQAGATLKTIIFSVHRSKEIYVCLCLLWHNDFIVYVCGCATDFTLLIIFRLCPFPPFPLCLLCCVCLFFYTDWCIFRSVLTRLEPCGFGFGFDLGPLLFGSQCGFLPLAHAKQKGGTRKLSFAGGRKSNGTRATLAQRSA